MKQQLNEASFTGKCSELTLSIHKILQKGAPVSWFRLKVVHPIKVKIGHYIVLCIAGDIDNLQSKKRFILIRRQQKWLIMISQAACECTVYPAVLLPKGLGYKLDRQMGFNQTRGGGKLVCQIFTFVKKS